MCRGRTLTLGRIEVVFGRIGDELGHVGLDRIEVVFRRIGDAFLSESDLVASESDFKFDELER